MNDNNGILGNSIDINIDPCNNAVEIRADVQVEEFLTKRLWGQIVNCQGKPMANTLIKLVKVVRNGCECEYIGMAHTVTDCEGFYQFDICAKEESHYKIIVNKAVVGDEMVIETGGGNCDTCEYNSYQPCKRPNRYYVEYEKCPHVSCKHHTPVEPQIECSPKCQCNVCKKRKCCKEATFVNVPNDRDCIKNKRNYATYSR
ncbi:MAG: hypothetical protein R3Y54_06960 [Eubacteriales bacterium]